MNFGLFKLSWPYIALLTAHITWGVTFLISKLALQEIPPMSLAFSRFALALILLLPFILTAKQKVKIEVVDLPKLIGMAILMVTLNIALFYFGLERTTITSASVLTMTIPVLSVLGGWWFLKEKVYLANLLGIFLGLLGAVLVIGLPFIVVGLSPSLESLLGQFLIILASITWVTGAIISKNLMKKYSTLTLTTVLFAVGAGTFLIPALLEYFQNPLILTKVTYLGLGSIVFLAIAPSICAYFLFEWGLSKLGIIKADLFQYLEPLVATTLGIIVLGEGLRFSFMAGAILIGLGVYWATYKKELHKHNKAHRT